eukprot:jgi/Botrbrau1/22720/Bobra.0132s0059.1
MVENKGYSSQLHISSLPGWGSLRPLGWPKCEAKSLCTKVEKQAAMETHCLCVRTAETRNSTNVDRIYQSTSA